MFKMFAVLTPLLLLALATGGCCCVGPACQPCGVSCDPCCDASCGDVCGTCDDVGCAADCSPPCGCYATNCSMPCICLPNPLAWVGCLFHKACQCDSGCGEVYWGSWYGDPPCCEPCDPCGNWVGCGCGSYGCEEGCGYGADCGCALPAGQCADCMQAPDVQSSQNGERMLTPSNITPQRAPVKPAPAPVKKSPQANRFYQMQMRR